MAESKDQFQRPLHDLRISVTDRCNLRCAYCMPPEHFGEDHCFLERKELLNFEEITRLTRAFTELGVRKIRLTGGEPLLRKGISELIRQLKGIEKIETIALTTNGILFEKFADELVDAGLDRVNISLDALDDELIKTITNRDYKAEIVLGAVDKAKELGLSPKVNMVVKKDCNESQIMPMVAYFKERRIPLRFIEYMDVGNHNRWDLSHVVPAKDILALIAEQFEYETLPPELVGEPATRYGYKDGSSEFGIITSVSNPFCSGCHRARLSSNGQLYTCLFANSGHDLRDIVRGGISDQALHKHIDGIWTKRSDRYSELRNAERAKAEKPKVEMSYIGG